MKFLVTGASGFIGWHLVDRLAQNGHDVFAWTRSDTNPWPQWQTERTNVDILSLDQVAAELKRAEADVVIHLAAQSLPMRAWADPVPSMRVNIEGTLNLLSAARDCIKSCRILVAGSSGQYANSDDRQRIDENFRIEPDSLYGISKLASDESARLYFRAFGLNVVRFRPFSWIGPRKVGDVASDLARRIVAIERGDQSLLRVGRIDIVRDFIDVRDGVAALLTLAERGRSGEVYNICRGEGTAISELIRLLQSKARVPFKIEADAALLRPVENRHRVGDAGRIQELGWRPSIPLEETVEDILDYWRDADAASAMV